VLTEVVEGDSAYAYIHPGNRIATIAALTKQAILMRLAKMSWMPGLQGNGLQVAIGQGLMVAQGNFLAREPWRIG